MSANRKIYFILLFFLVVISLFFSVQYSSVKKIEDEEIVLESPTMDQVIEGWEEEDKFTNIMSAYGRGKTAKRNSTTCMLVRTYRNSFPELLKMSLSVSFGGISLGGIRMFYILTGAKDEEGWNADLEDLELISKNINKIVGESGFSSVIPLPFKVVPDQDYGYYQTDYALDEYFYRGSSKFREKYSEGDGYLHPSNCTYLIITNGDNYYMKDWHIHIDKKLPADLVYFNMFSHQLGYWLNTKLKINQIDLGAAMYRLDLIKNNNLFFNQSTTRKFTWDGSFIEKASGLSNRTMKVERALFVHE